MKKKTAFDELNRLDSIAEYFEPMQISADGKARRHELTEYLIDAFLFFFATYDVHRQYYNLLEKETYTKLLADRITDAVTKVTGIDSYMSEHIRTISKSIVDTTFKNAPEDEIADKPVPQKANTQYTHSSPLNSSDASVYETLNRTENPQPAPLTYTSSGPLDIPEKTSGGPAPLKNSIYWLSYARAEDMAKSEANSFLNYTDYVDAKSFGARQKRWLTMLDDKVRETHAEVEGETIGIDELFTVGNSQMRFPQDMSESPDLEEVIGCRCSVEYI